ncbi:C1 family peptidase [Aureibaculum sp. 2210JD6-5]|uniref:C1 family peptidase n=1 Tax=Aureibaculum sp. 2210JD6-5 TaxID=3103957 RepID=UPI002AAEFF94|nr:C1 family peptidase [Aureibaculum sp. 2210JD6-5]MDY7396493.1 C1 family peptidase [Aureibaculum sp. 2210JD6-5]
MRKFAFLSLAILCLNCDDIQFSGNNEINNDNEFVIDPENQNFGAEGSFCYGFSEPTTGNKADIEIPSTFPGSLDLSSFLPPIGNQGKQGSCVAWATGYYLKGYQENVEDANNSIQNPNNLLSPAFIYNQIKVADCDSGSQIPSALELISDTGIVTLSEMPYNENECQTQPTETQINLAEENKIMSFSYLDGDTLFNQAKAFLNKNQPIVIAISIDRNHFGKIDANGDAVYREFENADGSHAMLVVGYDDAKNAFKVVNSWGESWGNNGFVWIDYKAFEDVLDTGSDFKILCEAWVTEDVISVSI